MKMISLVIMSVLYVFAGANHFINTEFYLKIMPPYLPMHLEVVYISGVIEILLGLLLLLPETRKLAAWGLILLLLAVFPANIYHLSSGGAGMGFPVWSLVIRLPVQFLLIYWAYGFTKD